MDAQDYFSVIFHNVKEYYSPDNAINCQFSVKENTAIDEPANCFVGIFVVAWDALDNVIAKKSFTSVELESRGGIYDLTFDIEETPSSNFDDKEFYQFCFYNTVTKEVLGGSGPFQICNSREESLIHIEEFNDTAENIIPFLTLPEDEVSWWLKGNNKPVDEDLEDTVLIHNKTTLMEHALVNAAKEKEEALLATKQKFESELKQFTSEKKEIIEKGVAEVNHLKQLIESLTESESSLRQGLIDSQKDVKQMEDFAAANTQQTEILIHNLSLEKEALTKAMADKEAGYIEHINKIKTELYAKIEASESRCDDLNKSLIAEKKVLEKMEFDYEEIILNLKKEIELLGIRENECVTETSKNIAELQMKLNTEITQKYEYLNEIGKLTQSVDGLIEENKFKDTLLAAEREKLAALMLQQGEMTSRLSSENEKICFEIQKMKSHENSLVEAHQREITCHRNRIAEMETVSKEEKSKYKHEIDELNNELNDKINCVNLLEAKMRETTENVSHLEGLQEENLMLSDSLDELNVKLGELEEQNTQLTDESKKITPRKNSENGSIHALHVVNTYMKKQINTLKEKEINYSQQKSVESNPDLVRENKEFKLRICMGKKELDKQYRECQKLRNEVSKLKQSISNGNSNETVDTKDEANLEAYNTLLSEYNNLKSDQSKRIDELLTEVRNLNEQNETTRNELSKATEEKDDALKLNEELRAKLVQLVGHFEGKINLLMEENGMLKTQRTVLMQGGGNTAGVKQSSPDIVQTVASVTREQPNLIQINRNVSTKTVRKNKEGADCQDEPRNVPKVVNRQSNIVNPPPPIVNRPPPVNERVVKKQPTLIPNVMYPPSMAQRPIPPTEPQEISRPSVAQRPIPLTEPQEISRPSVVQRPIPPTEPQEISRPSVVKRPIYPTEPQEISRSPTGEVASARVVSDPLINKEPPSQVMPNRTSITEQPLLSGRGRPNPMNDVPEKQCPICSLDFPAGFTDATKSEHVNAHFE